MLISHDNGCDDYYLPGTVLHSLPIPTIKFFQGPAALMYWLSRHGELKQHA